MYYAPYKRVYLIDFLAVTPKPGSVLHNKNERVGRPKILICSRCLVYVKILCSKYHFSEGELSGTSYSTKSTPPSCRPTTSPVVKLFSRRFSKRETPGRFLSARREGAYTRFFFFLVLKTSRHLKMLTNVLWGKKIKGR